MKLPWQKPPAVALAIKAAEVEAERKLLDHSTGADVKRAELEAAIAEKKEERARVREAREWTIVSRASNGEKDALAVLEMLKGKRRPDNTDPMQAVMMQVLVNQLNRNPLADFVAMRDVLDDVGPERDRSDEGGLADYVKEFLRGAGATAAQSLPHMLNRVAPQLGTAPVEPPPPAGLLPAEVAEAQAHAAEQLEDEQVMAQIPTADEVMMRLQNTSPDQFARWGVAHPAVQGMLDQLLEYDDADVITELQKIRTASIFNPRYFAARAVAEKLGYLPVIDWLLTHPERTLAIVQAAREQIEGGDDEPGVSSTLR